MRLSFSGKYRPRVGVSACLQGQPVRYDGGHKDHALIARLLAPRLQLEGFCPELSAGLGLPRPPVKLVATDRGLRAIGVEDPSLDVTAALRSSAREYCDSQLNGLSGFIFKSRSPSCGLGSSPIHMAVGTEQGSGLFASAVTEAAPWLACVEESWLDDPDRCFRFATACCLVAYREHGERSHSELLEDCCGDAISEIDPSHLLDDVALGEKRAALEERLRDYWQQ